MSTQLPFELGQFGNGVELSIGHISTGIEMSGHFEVSRIQNVLGSEVSGYHLTSKRVHHIIV